MNGTCLLLVFILYCSANILLVAAASTGPEKTPSKLNNKANNSYKLAIAIILQCLLSIAVLL